MTDLSQLNISPDFKGTTRRERRILRVVVARDKTPAMIRYFAKHCAGLGDYWYWFTLASCWVSYTGFSELQLWRRLFGSARGNRLTSLMKPDEYAVFSHFDDTVKCYRAHRPGEQDWLSLTLQRDTAARFARDRDVSEVVEYEIARGDIYCLFLRRGEFEILVMDNRQCRQVGVWGIDYPSPSQNIANCIQEVKRKKGGD